jgi:hypothetical protein
MKTSIIAHEWSHCAAQASAAIKLARAEGINPTDMLKECSIAIVANTADGVGGLSHPEHTELMRRAADVATLAPAILASSEAQVRACIERRDFGLLEITPEMSADVERFKSSGVKLEDAVEAGLTAAALSARVGEFFNTYLARTKRLFELEPVTALDDVIPLPVLMNSASEARTHFKSLYNRKHI